MCDWGVDVPRKPLPPQTTSFFFAGEAIGRRGGVVRRGRWLFYLADPRRRVVDITPLSYA